LQRKLSVANKVPDAFVSSQTSLLLYISCVALKAHPPYLSNGWVILLIFYRTWSLNNQLMVCLLWGGGYQQS